MGAPIDLTGRTFGSLTIVKPVGRVGLKHGRHWLCRCACGNEIVRAANALAYGRTTRCPTCRYIAARSTRPINPPPSIEGATWLPVHPGAFALVDTDVFERVKNYAWTLMACGYARRNIILPDGTKGSRLLHHEVVTVDDGRDIDHRNRNKLDCRRTNIRPATRAQNLANRGRRVSNTSGAKGVVAQHGKWTATISLGTFHAYPVDAQRER